jgi:hypothetical protein
MGFNSAFKELYNNNMKENKEFQVSVKHDNICFYFQFLFLPGQHFSVILPSSGRLYKT